MEKFKLGVALGAVSALAGVANAESLLSMADPPPPPAEDWSFLNHWDGSADLGFNGSTGNSETFSGRGGLNFARKTDRNESKAGISYQYATQDSARTKSRGEAFARNDWILEKGSPWRIFATLKAEYDEDQDWKFRFSGFAGVGYAFIDDDRTQLIGRIGPGFSTTTGGTDDETRFELDIGADFSHKITDRQKITATVDYYPDLGDLWAYRLVAKAQYEIVVDPETKMSLKLGAEDRYDSSPAAGTKKNDFEYFGLLSWAF